MYLFMTRSEMEIDIKCGRFLEHGEYDGNLYGTKIDSIHEVVDSGKICILDVNPQVLFPVSCVSINQFSSNANKYYSYNISYRVNWFVILCAYQHL